jgi:hypothetical protein
MKKLIIYVQVVVVILLTSISCESVIEFKGSEAEPKTVIYSLLHPDSLITVSVAESHAVFEERYEPGQITNAVVRLYRDGDLIETLTYVPAEAVPDYYPANPYSKYVSQMTRPVPGSTYRIEAEVPGMGKASGEARLPDPVTITGIDTTTVISEWGESQIVVKLQFQDPAGTDNFYRFSARSVSGSYPGNKQEPYSPMIPVVVTENNISYGAYTEPLIAPQQEDDIFGMYLENHYYLFTDELISGKEYGLTLKYQHTYPQIEYFEFVHAIFSLHSISRDLYLYLQSYSAHMQTRDNFLAEPVLVYTNIKGGLGVVGAMTTSVDTVMNGEYPVDGVVYEYYYK